MVSKKEIFWCFVTACAIIIVAPVILAALWFCWSWGFWFIEQWPWPEPGLLGGIGR